MGWFICPRRPPCRFPSPSHYKVMILNFNWVPRKLPRRSCRLLALTAFSRRKKRGTPLRVTLKKGKVFIGKFTSYDSVEELAWFEAPV